MTAAGDAGANVAKLVTPAQQAKSSTWPTAEMMALWREHGGSQHGPRIETATIPLHLLPRFMAAWVSRRVAEVLAERDRLAADLATARADAAKARGDALEQAARVAALEDEREVLRRRLGPKHAVPDTIYHPDAEFCVAWSDRFDEDQITCEAHDGPVRYEASVRVADRWCVMIPLAVEEDGSWDGMELRWFDTEKQAADAREDAGGNILARALKTRTAGGSDGQS